MIEKIIEKFEELARASSSAQTEAIIGMQGALANFYNGEKSAYEKAIEIVQEVAKEYGNVSDTDLSVVSALPSLYPLQKFEEEAIHKVVASAKDGDWIPCSSGQMPNECEEVDVTIEEIDGDVYTSTSWLQEGVWVVKKTALQPRVIAWKTKSAPYQKGEPHE